MTPVTSSTALPSPSLSPSLSPSATRSQQAGRLALVAKLFHVNGKAAHGGKIGPRQGAASPPLTPPPLAQTNSSGGLVSMFESLQTIKGNSVSDPLSRVFQAVGTHADGSTAAQHETPVPELTSGSLQSRGRPMRDAAQVRPDDANGDGLISRQEVSANPVAGQLSHNFTAVDSDSDGQLSKTELNQFQPLLRHHDGSGPALGGHPALGTTLATGLPAWGHTALVRALQLVLAQPKVGPGTTSSQRYTDLLQSLAKAA